MRGVRYWKVIYKRLSHLELNVFSAIHGMSAIWDIRYWKVSLCYHYYQVIHFDLKIKQNEKALWLKNLKKKRKIHRRILTYKYITLKKQIFFRSIFKQIYPRLRDCYRVCMNTYLYFMPRLSFFCFKDFSDLAASLAPKGIRSQTFSILCFLFLY